MYDDKEKIVCADHSLQLCRRICYNTACAVCAVIPKSDFICTKEGRKGCIAVPIRYEMLGI